MFDAKGLRRAVSLSDTAKKFGVKLKAQGKEFWGCCPFHREDTPSFSVFCGKDGVQRFFCFGCSDKPGDVIEFVQEIKGVEFQAACEILGGTRNAPENRPAIETESIDVYAGIDAADHGGSHPFKVGKRSDLYNPKREREGSILPALIHEYRDAAGALLGLVIRQQIGDRKETPTVRYVRLPDGRQCWARVPFDRPRPIYGLDRIGDAKQVIVGEGEKVRDAIMKVGRRVAVAWPGGTNSIHHVDWTPLAGKNIILWPDADRPGVECMAALADILVSLPETTVRILDILRGKAS